MKKILLALVLTGTLLVPIVALAASPCSNLGKTACQGTTGCMWRPITDTSGECLGTSITTMGGFISKISVIGNWIFSALLAIVVIMLVLAGFFWITAGGDPANVKKASDMLRNALIGLAIALGAKGLIAIVAGLLA